MTPQIITTLVIIVAMFALMLLNKFPLAVTMTLTGVALWLTGIVEPAKLYSNFADRPSYSLSVCPSRFTHLK